MDDRVGLGVVSSDEEVVPVVGDLVVLSIVDVESCTVDGELVDTPVVASLVEDVEVSSAVVPFVVVGFVSAVVVFCVVVVVVAGEVVNPVVTATVVGDAISVVLVEVLVPVVV